MLETEEKTGGGFAATGRLLADKLNEEIEKGNDTVAFVIAMILAVMKDVLDGVANITLFGSGGLLFIAWLGIKSVGTFLSAFLFAFMWGKGWFITWRIRIIHFLLGFVVENIPAVDTLPMETLKVLYAWRLTKKRAKKAQEHLGNIQKMSAEEMEKLMNNMEVLEER